MTRRKRDASADQFPGWTRPKSNYTQVPNAFWDQLPNFETLAELKVVLYILRHTWGYVGVKQRRISVDEFQNGRKNKEGGRIDKGVGMTRANIMKGLKLAQQHGFITVETDERDKARRSKTYQLRMKGASRQETGIKTIPEENDATGTKTIPQRYQNDTAEVLNQDLDHGKKARKESLETKKEKAASAAAPKKPAKPKADAKRSPEEHAAQKAIRDAIVKAFGYEEGRIGSKMESTIAVTAWELVGMKYQAGHVPHIYRHCDKTLTSFTVAALTKYAADARVELIRTYGRDIVEQPFVIDDAAEGTPPEFSEDEPPPGAVLHNIEDLWDRIAEDIDGARVAGKR